MSRKIIYTDDAPEPIGPYSQAVYINGMLFNEKKAAQKTKDDANLQTIRNIAKGYQFVRNGRVNYAKTEEIQKGLLDIKATNSDGSLNTDRMLKLVQEAYSNLP